MIARVRITDAERRVLEKGLLAPPAFRERRHRRLALLAYCPFSSDHTRCRQNPHALKQGLLEQHPSGT
jgi:hypothetical protein